MKNGHEDAAAAEPAVRYSSSKGDEKNKIKEEVREGDIPQKF